MQVPYPKEDKQIVNAATLYIVATPIGNLADMSQRALQILQEVDLIAAEDTRHSQLLLNHYGIKKPMWSYHAHNETQQAMRLIAKLEGGQNIALISDAGTPLISDPGFTLIQSALQAGINVVPIPGATALIAALSAAGLPSDRFYFAGFLPAKAAARERQLSKLQGLTCTLIFYAAPHRIIDVLDSMIGVFGATRQAVIARELTKKFESFYHGELTMLKQQLLEHPQQQKGEFVILVQGENADEQPQQDAQIKALLDILLAEVPLKLAVKLATKITGVNKNKVYELALSIKNDEDHP